MSSTDQVIRQSLAQDTQFMLCTTQDRRLAALFGKGLREFAMRQGHTTSQHLGGLRAVMEEHDFVMPKTFGQSPRFIDRRAAT